MAQTRTPTDMLRPCDPAYYWPQIRETVEELVDYLGCKTPVDYVERLIGEGSAHLWVAPEGFIIWRLYREPDGSRTFFIWFAHGRRANPVEHYEHQILDMARECGADNIEFRSPRRGWERVLDSHWQVAHVAYRWRLN